MCMGTRPIVALRGNGIMLALVLAILLPATIIAVTVWSGNQHYAVLEEMKQHGCKVTHWYPIGAFMECHRLLRCTAILEDRALYETWRRRLRRSYLVAAIIIPLCYFMVFLFT